MPERQLVSLVRNGRSIRNIPVEFADLADGGWACTFDVLRHHFDRLVESPGHPLIAFHLESGAFVEAIVSTWEKATETEYRIVARGAGPSPLAVQQALAAHRPA